MSKQLGSLLCLFIYFTQSLYAQQVKDFTFFHLGQADGMYSQRVYTIQQTDDGALWWTSKKGVDRYNGAVIKHYELKRKYMLGSAAGLVIRLSRYQQDDESTLMAFDNNGNIFSYDPELDEFILDIDIRDLLKKDVQLHDILKTQEGTWLATSEGVYFLNDGRIKTVKEHCHVNCIVQTKFHLLFCTRTEVLMMSLKNKKATLKTIAPLNIESGYYDKVNQKVWLGGYACGLWILSLDGREETSSLEMAVPANGNSMVNYPVRSIIPYDDKTMLIGIDGYGVYKVNRTAHDSKAFQATLLFDANEGPHGVLHGNGVYAVLRDTWGNIVVGSYSGGIDIARPVGSTPAIFQHTDANGKSVLNDRVNCVDQLDNGTLVMGTDNGVSLYNPQMDSWIHTCRGVVVIDFCKTATGSILAATYGKGVFEISSNGQARQLYTEANGILKDDHVYKLFYDRDGGLWMGCLEGPLVQKTAGGCHYHNVNYVNDILQLPDGRVVVGTSFNVQLITPSTGKVEELNFYQEMDDVNKFAVCLYLNENKLWIGTDGGGVFVYDLQEKTSQRITAKDGLPSNCISSINKDVFGRIMVATEQGLAFVSPSTPLEVVDINYCYGLEREYTRGAVVPLQNGHMLFGSTTGAIVINPINTQKLNYSARLHLRSVRCKEDDSDVFKRQTSRMLKDKNLWLKYSQRTFDLYFESINMRNQFDVMYQYKIGNGEWSIPTEQQFIRFNNLESGKHRLTLRSVSRTSKTTLDEIELTITIAQPWWNSWWMWIVYIVLVAMAFYGAWNIYLLHEKYMRLTIDYLQLSKKDHVHVDVATGTISNETENVSQEKEANGAQDFVDKATKIIVEHLGDADFTIDQLCREMAMSRTLFYVKLKSFTGKSPQDFIRIIRLERAAALLRSGRSVTDVAALTGFDNPKYFSTVFKKYFEVSPSKYQ